MWKLTHVNPFVSRPRCYCTQNIPKRRITLRVFCALTENRVCFLGCSLVNVKLSTLLSVFTNSGISFINVDGAMIFNHHPSRESRMKGWRNTWLTNDSWISRWRRYCSQRPVHLSISYLIFALNPHKTLH